MASGFAVIPQHNLDDALNSLADDGTWEDSGDEADGTCAEEGMHTLSLGMKLRPSGGAPLAPLPVINESEVLEETKAVIHMSMGSHGGAFHDLEAGAGSPPSPLLPPTHQRGPYHTASSGVDGAVAAATTSTTRASTNGAGVPKGKRKGKKKGKGKGKKGRKRRVQPRRTSGAMPRPLVHLSACFAVLVFGAVLGLVMYSYRNNLGKWFRAF